jgi:hypothetical protein
VQSSPASTVPDPWIPIWISIAALVVSIAALAPQVLAWISDARLRGTIIFSLTRDIFFRYSELGEILFVNSVIASRGKPLLIRSIEAELQLMGAASKRLPLRLLNLGAPADRGTTMHDHIFFSSSPIDLVPAGMPLRRIHLFVIGEYDNALRTAFEELRAEAGQLATAPGAADDATKQLILDQAEKAGEQFLNDYFASVQLESGTYRLDMTLIYEEADSPHGGKARTVASSIEFTVPRDLRDRLRNDMRRTIRDVFMQSLSSDATVAYPVFAPATVTVLPPKKEQGGVGNAR